MTFLTCEPYLGNNLEKKNEYIDEADKFFNDPTTWYTQNPNVFEGVTYLVLFENLQRLIMDGDYNSEKSVYEQKTIKDFLLDFPECEYFYNSIIQPTERTDKIILVCRHY